MSKEIPQSLLNEIRPIVETRKSASPEESAELFHKAESLLTDTESRNVGLKYGGPQIQAEVRVSPPFELNIDGERQFIRAEEIKDFFPNGVHRRMGVSITLFRQFKHFNDVGRWQSLFTYSRSSIKNSEGNYYLLDRELISAREALTYMLENKSANIDSNS